MFKVKILSLNDKGDILKELDSFTTKESHPFDQMNIVVKKQREVDVLKIGEPCSIKDNVSSFRKENNKWSNFFHTKDSTGLTLKKVQVFKNGKWEDFDLYLGLISYPYGYCISTNKKLNSIFGQTNTQAVFQKITKKRFICSNYFDAKHFKSLGEVLQYLKKNQSVFSEMTGKYNYQFNLDYASSDFKEEIMNFYQTKPNKKEKDDAIIKEIDKLLKEINNSEPQLPYKYHDIPKEFTVEAQLLEAENRLKALNMGEIVLPKFKKGHLFFSEFSGILYDLNENAKKAIEELKKLRPNSLPYHVLRVQTQFGDIYYVLFVSDVVDYWEDERPDREGYLYVYGYNSTNLYCSEFGEIHVESMNGGISIA